MVGFDWKPLFGNLGRERYKFKTGNMEGAVLGGVSVCLSVRENYVTLFIVDEKGYIFLPSQSAKSTIRIYSDYPAIPFITQL